jgi:hypothetical protein
VEIQVVGVEQLAAVARDLKAAGDRDLRKELFRGIQRGARPLKAEARAAALDELPQSGGLAARVASAKFTVNVRLGARNPSIRITGKGQIGSVTGNVYDLNSMDRGRIRHMTYGHKPWKDQTIKPGWFSDRMERAADTGVRAEILSAMTTVQNKLGGSHV